MIDPKAIGTILKRYNQLMSHPKRYLIDSNDNLCIFQDIGRGLMDSDIYRMVMFDEYFSFSFFLSFPNSLISIR